jgi:ribose transport system substrate-binding protein
MLSRIRGALIAGFVAAGVFAGALPATHAAQVQQVGRDAYFKNLKGKKVIFVPISQGFDLNQAWVVVWQRHAARYGFTLEVRDPNMNTDAGIRALQGAIAEKPDLIIVQNPDIQTYAR